MGKKTDRAAAALTKDEKSIVLNRISNGMDELERWLPQLQKSREWGLQKGKGASTVSAHTIERVEDLLEALKLYASSEFKLDDMQDYSG